MKDMKILITGGAGFLALNLAHRLAIGGADVFLADVVDYTISYPAEGKRPHSVRLNVAKAADFDSLPRDFDFVYHFAALSSPAACDTDPDQAFKLNVQGTYNVLRYCARNSVGKVVFPSGGHLYGDHPNYLPLDEKHPVDLMNHVYNATKKLGENLCAEFWKSHGLKYVAFRLFNVYGPGQSTEYFVPSMIMQALREGRVTLRNGKPRRDFTYVSDVVDAFVMAIQSSYFGGPMNIGTGKDTSTLTVAKFVAKTTGAKLVVLEEKAFGPMRARCDNSLARSKLGWKPKTTLEEGLKESIDWYSANALA